MYPIYSDFPENKNTQQQVYVDHHTSTTGMIMTFTIYWSLQGGSVKMQNLSYPHLFNGMWMTSKRSSCWARGSQKRGQVLSVVVYCGEPPPHYYRILFRASFWGTSSPTADEGIAGECLSFLSQFPENLDCLS